MHESTPVPSKREWTDAEKDKFGKTLEALSAAKQDAEARGFRQGNGGRSSVPCPVCGLGKISYSVASVNGHMWARCSTPDCVRWME